MVKKIPPPLNHFSTKTEMDDFGRYAQQISRYKFDDDVNDKQGAKIRARRLHQSLINEDYNNLEKINKTYAQMG